MGPMRVIGVYGRSGSVIKLLNADSPRSKAEMNIAAIDVNEWCRSGRETQRVWCYVARYGPFRRQYWVVLSLRDFVAEGY